MALIWLTYGLYIAYLFFATGCKTLSYTEKTLQSGVIKMVKEQYWLYPLPLGTVLTLQVND